VLNETPAGYTIDVVMLTPQNDQLAILLTQREPASSVPEERWTLPWEAPAESENLDNTAAAIATRVTGTSPAWIEQVGAFGGGLTHPTNAAISVAFVALVPLGTPSPQEERFAWFKLEELPPLDARQQAMVRQGVAAVRDRIDLAPVAFRLLPAAFTLSELQQMYELLLGKRLHKASFRRALQAAWLVEPTDEWRSEGRGRPAQLYRYAPKKRRKGRRGVRFDLLTS
jgi:8-oxo-dGTP diphosphatase